jgi:hypothetical protein
VSDQRRYRGRHARSGFRPGWLLAPLLVVALAIGVGGALLARAGGRVGPARPAADSTVAPTTSATVAPTTSAPPPRSSRTTSATRNSTTLAPTTTRPQGSLLQLGAARPRGVAALMDVDQGGASDSPCSEFNAEVQVPTVWVGGGPQPTVTSLGIASPLRMCLLRFASTTPITVTIRAPTGRVERRTAPAPCPGEDCASQVDWAARPGIPLGNYDVTAVQGDLEARATVSVEPAREPSLLVIGGVTDEEQRVTVRRGATVGIAIGGFRPRQSVGLLFYHTPSQARQPKDLRFRAWTTVRTDAGGAAVLRLRTSQGDPPGCYVANTWPPLRAGFATEPSELWATQSSWHQFCLR